MDAQRAGVWARPRLARLGEQRGDGDGGDDGVHKDAVRVGEDGRDPAAVVVRVGAGGR